MKRLIEILVCLALLAGAVVYTHKRFTPSSTVDPDRYFHFAVSREIVENGLPYSLPQVAGLGWGKFFAEKEFLFHQLTALAWRLGGDDGVARVPLFLLLITCGILFFLLMQFLRPWQAALFLFSLLLCNDFLLFRLHLVRPHTLAIPLLLLLATGVAKKNRWLVCVAAALFALSYHAYYLPLLVVGLGALFFDRKLVGFGLLGIAIGILLNPYFPTNWLMMWTHLKIALSSNSMGNLNYGSELFPLTTKVLLYQFCIPMAVFLLAVYLYVQNLSKRAPQPTLIFFLTLAGVFWTLTFQSPRAVEYALPLTVIAAAVVVVALNPRVVQLFFLVLTLGATAQGYTVYFAPVPSVIPLATNALAAAKEIPTNPSKKNVFNCEWDRGPFLLYTRPDLKFIDILDPSFLYIHNLDAHNARSSLLKGYTANAWGLLKHAFKADYVYCANLDVADQLDQDPRFLRIYPKKNSSAINVPFQMYVYELKEEEMSNFVEHFLAAPLPIKRLEEFQSLSLAQAGPIAPFEASQPYLNLFPLVSDSDRALLAKSEVSDLTLCAVVKPSPAEMKRLQGKEFIGFGGGRHVRAWLNRQELFITRRPFLKSKIVSALVPLPAPLKATDDLSAIYCAAGNAPFWGASLSFWSLKEIQAVCAESVSSEGVKVGSWAYEYGDSSLCMGGQARKNFPVK